MDWNASFGMFYGPKLIGFIIHGIGYHQDELTAFNTGTGVVPEFRSQKVIDRLYETAIPILRQRGVAKCMLEVIQDNDRAIKVYERIGFRVTRSLKCFQGTINPKQDENYFAEQIPFEYVIPKNQPFRDYYSWDNSNNAVIRSGEIYRTYLVKDNNNDEKGYFIINPASGYIPQLECLNGRTGSVLRSIAGISREVRINNIDERRTDLIDTLIDHGLTNTINQYEMEMHL